MTRLPVLTGKDLTAAPVKAGFEVVRIKGSHHYLRHADGVGHQWFRFTRVKPLGLDLWGKY